MANKKKSSLNEEQIIAFLRDSVTTIRTEVDPLELNEYRRLFRKAVPFTLRAYFSAWVLKQLDDGNMPTKIASFSSGKRMRSSRRNERSGRQDRSEIETKTGRNSSRVDPRRERLAKDRDGSSENRKGRDADRSAEPRSHEPRPVLPDDISTTLFISIGRNRRVYPRDLIGLIIQNAGLDREHIGEIRVLDNYSFVQVISEDAETVISALNEFEYRGRKLAVSYSRKRDDSATESTASHSSDEDTSTNSDNGFDTEESGYDDNAYSSEDTLENTYVPNEDE